MGQTDQSCNETCTHILALDCAVLEESFVHLSSVIHSSVQHSFEVWAGGGVMFCNAAWKGGKGSDINGDYVMVGGCGGSGWGGDGVGSGKVW